MLTREVENAKASIVSVEAVLNGKREPDGLFLKCREAAERLNVTVDTLRRKKTTSRLIGAGCGYNVMLRRN